MLTPYQWGLARRKMCQEHGFDHDRILKRIKDITDVTIISKQDTDVKNVSFRVNFSNDPKAEGKLYVTTIEVRKEAIA